MKEVSKSVEGNHNRNHSFDRSCLSVKSDYRSRDPTQKRSKQKVAKKSIKMASNIQIIINKHLKNNKKGGT